MSDEGLVSLGRIADEFDITGPTLRKWRQRYDDFPSPVMEPSKRYPLYRLSDLWDWYIQRWPERSSRREVYLHKFTLDGAGVVGVETSPFGPVPQASGYLKAVRDLLYGDWQVWSTKTGFVAQSDGHTHIWATDPAEAPQEWFVYEQRYKTAGRNR